MEIYTRIIGMIGCVGAMYYLYKSSTDEDWLYFVLIIAFYCVLLFF